MTKVETSKATGLQLDWGVGLARDYTQLTLQVAGKVYGTAPDGQREQISHADPRVCMGLIKKLSIHGVSLADFSSADSGSVEFCCEADFKHHSGDTLEQAVARCFLELVLGKVFEVPDELGVQL